MGRWQAALVQSLYQVKLPQHVKIGRSLDSDVSGHAIGLLFRAGHVSYG